MEATIYLFSLDYNFYLNHRNIEAGLKNAGNSLGCLSGKKLLLDTLEMPELSKSMCQLFQVKIHTFTLKGLSESPFQKVDREQNEELDKATMKVN